MPKALLGRKYINSQMIIISYKETEKIEKEAISSLPARQYIIGKDNVLLDDTEIRQKPVSNFS
jgi:predicted house-cleaning NTP pyrophosphatase (Maf/HAM1 superfamily)